MKRKILVLLIMLFLVSCGKKENVKEEVKIVENKNTEAVTEKPVDFNFEFKKIIVEENKDKREFIAGKNDGLNFSVYSLGVEVNVEIKGERMSLKDAIANKKIKMEDIFLKIDTDINRKFAKEDTVKDGGSRIIEYTDGFTVVKFNTIEGNLDMYFTNKVENFNGFKEMVEEKTENEK